MQTASCPNTRSYPRSSWYPWTKEAPGDEGREPHQEDFFLRENALLKT